MSALASSISIACRLVCEPARRRLEWALNHPREAQNRVLGRLLDRASASAFGREHGLHRIRTIEAFRQAVAVGDYASHRQWIARLESETTRDVLTSGPVEAFERSSGSTAACKMIPINAALRAEFTEAVRAWMGDLHRRHPRATSGPAWWLVSPLPQAPPTASGLRVGMGSDDEFLGTWERWIAPHLFAVPPDLSKTTDLTENMDQTLRCLLHTPGLRLISVWNASYLNLIWQRLLAHGEALFESLARGGEVSGRRLSPMPNRAKELRDRWEEGTLTPACVWPDLALLSAWDGVDADESRRLFSGAAFQAKGLLATEGVVTLPWGDDAGACVPALNSHFLEFEETDGRIVSSYELEPGGEYGVILTTGGGLWRYRLGDTVRADARCGGTCRLRFVGRNDGVCDLRGEKLHPGMVAEVLDRLPLEFAMLAPGRDHYILYASTDETGHASNIDRELKRNPHYALCRANGQLGPVRLFQVREDGRSACLRRTLAEGGRPGTMKSTALSRLGGWEHHFRGGFVDKES